MTVNKRTAKACRGFTMIEVLVVVGIIALLVSLLLPMIFRASRNAKRLRAQSDLEVIGQALTHYKDDFGDIPRIDYTQPAGSVAGGIDSGPFPNTGAAVLCRALLGPGNATLVPADVAAFQTGKEYKVGDFVRVGNNSTFVLAKSLPSPVPDPAADSNHQYWTPFWVFDGADGPGWKVRVGAGKTWGPYLDPQKMAHQGCLFLDPSGGPILYFPARAPRPTVTIDSTDTVNEPYVSAWTGAAYNCNDGIEFFRRLVPIAETDNKVVVNRMRCELGDYNASGFIDNSETAAVVPYLLITPGADGIFGPPNYDIPAASPITDVDKINDIKKHFAACDDVTNFAP